MPSNYFGPRVSLITPLGFPLTLQITSGAQTLVNGGSTAVTVTDGLNTVTGCALVISDSTKATASAQTVTGTADSGTYSVQATKAGYNTSAPVTFTCLGSLDALNADTIGLGNGASVPSWTDSLGIAWTEATNQPTYVTGAINGHNAVAFNGTSQILTAASSISVFNGTTVAVLLLVKEVADSPASNEQWLRNMDAGNSEGWNIQRSTTNFQRENYYTAVVTTQTMTAGTNTLTTPNWYRSLYVISQGHQYAYVNGVLQAGSRTDATYRNCVTAPPSPSIGSSGGANFAKGQLTRIHVWNLAANPSVTTIAQMDLFGKNWLGQ